MSYFEDGGHDFRPPLAAAYSVASAAPAARYLAERV